MWRLPRLTSEGPDWPLPLLPRTSVAAVRALLADSQEESRQRWAEQLESDPALALWVLCAAQRASSVMSPLDASLDGVLDAPVAPRILADWLCSRSPGIWRAREADYTLSAEIAACPSWQRLLVYLQSLTGRPPAADAAERTSSALATSALSPTDTFWQGVAEFLVRWRLSLAPRTSGRDASSMIVPNWLHSLAEATAADTGGFDGDGNEHPVATRDEWGQDLILPLVAARLCEQQATIERLESTLEQRKLSALRELAYGASHEINNPLANISTRAQSLLRDERDPDRRRKLATIHTQAMRAHEMISDLMFFAKPPALRPVRLELAGMLASAVTESSSDAVHQGTALEHQTGPAGLSVVADGDHLMSCLRSLVRNALEALGEGGRIVLTCRQADDSFVEVTVSDNGPGLSDAARQHAFDPFYSGREAGRGLGFGLAKCWRVVGMHGGEVSITSAAGRGTIVTLRLPVVPESAVESPLS
ncbi:MAG: HAMP domain-containing histidine kinase [Planctomycetes bacterium]|nr:HAMP domain-containing histidine kinase [Planctomycetota bacterium]